MGNEPSTPASSTTDDDSVVRMRTDQAAFAALYDRYYPRIIRYCLRRLFDRSTAEDATSEVFLKVAANVRTFPGTTESDFRRWLFRIATNVVNAHRTTHRAGGSCWQLRSATVAWGGTAQPRVAQSRRCCSIGQRCIRP